jgi:small-conductance mechanosensitive channel
MRKGRLAPPFGHLLLVVVLAIGPMVPAHADVTVLPSLTGAAATDRSAKGQDKAAPAEDAAAIDQALAAAQEELRRVRSDPAATPAVATQEEILTRDHYLSELVEKLTRHKDQLARLPDFRKARDEAESRLAAWHGFDTPPPYSLLLVDQLRQALDTARVEKQARLQLKTLLQAQSADAEKQFNTAEAQARQREERLAAAATPVERDRQLWLRDLARLTARAAGEEVAAYRFDDQVVDAAIDHQQADIALLEAQLRQARTDVRFTQAELETILAGIDGETAAVEAEIAQLTAGLPALRDRIAKSQAAMVGVAGTEADLLRQQAEIDTQELENQNMFIQMDRHRLESLGWQRSAWKFRWLVANTADPETFAHANQELDHYIERLDTWGRYSDRVIALSIDHLAELDLRRKRALSPREVALVEHAIAQEQDKAEHLRRVQQDGEIMRRMLVVWRQDIREGRAERSLSSRLKSVGGEMARLGMLAWNFELFAAEDNLTVDGRTVVASRSITVGKTAGVVLLLVVGSFLIQLGLRAVSWVAVRRLGAHPGRTATLLRWIHAVLFSMLALLALTSANIPLTVFAFLGGALAIGVGFGTQVLLKNMISGIMLLVERPLRLGDRIEVGAVVGTVTHIGVRSSTVRTSDGIEILVPNATFIENNVTNWTYSSGKVRRSIAVSLRHGVSSQRVSEMLMAVAAEHPEVVADPPPRVLLEDFGDEKKRYQLQYWIDYGRGADGSQIASDLRLAIEKEAFAKGLAVPFPEGVGYVKAESAEGQEPAATS